MVFGLAQFGRGISRSVLRGVLGAGVLALVLGAKGQCFDDTGKQERAARDLACLTQSVTQITAAARRVSCDAAYGFYGEGYCVLGTFLRARDYADTVVVLNQGQRYMFIAGGDENARDLDIKVLNSSGREMAKDTQPGTSPVLRFTPTQTGRYAVRMKLQSGYRMSFCTLVLLERGGRMLSVDTLSQTIAGYVNSAVLAACTVDANLRVSQEPGTWVLCGSVLQEGEATTLSGVDLGSHRHMFLSCGSDDVEDVDLALEGSLGIASGSDTEDDAVPVFECVTDSSESYRLETSLNSAGSPSLVLSGVLDLW